MHNVSLNLYQTSATAGPAHQIKCSLREWVPVVCWISVEGQYDFYDCCQRSNRAYGRSFSHAPEVMNPTGPKWQLNMAHKPGQLQNTASDVIM